MRKRMVSTGFAIASGLLLALNGAPVAAQTELAMAARVGGPIEKAVELEQKAQALYNQPDRYADAARLHVRAAELRPVGDPMHIRDLAMAGRLFFYAGKKAEALDAMESGATAALSAGDILSAANAFVDASHLAAAVGRMQDAARLSERAKLLTNSPLLSAADRSYITRRLDAFEA